MDKAGFLARFIAWLLDDIFMAVLAFFTALILGGLAGLTASTESSFLGFISAGLTALLIIVMLLFQFIYFGYFWSRNGRSLGMRLLGMKVVRRSADEELSFVRAGLRGTLGYWFSGLIFALGYLWALIDQDRETWHDKIFDTWVVKG